MIWDLYEGVGEIGNDEKDACARSGRIMEIPHRLTIRARTTFKSQKGGDGGGEARDW